MATVDGIGSAGPTLDSEVETLKRLVPNQVTLAQPEQSFGVLAKPHPVGFSDLVEQKPSFRYNGGDATVVSSVQGGPNPKSLSAGLSLVVGGQENPGASKDTVRAQQRRMTEKTMIWLSLITAIEEDKRGENKQERAEGATEATEIPGNNAIDAAGIPEGGPTGPQGASRSSLTLGGARMGAKMAA